MSPARPPAEFTAPSPFDASHPQALAIYCSDGRFTQAVEELLHALGHARIDTLTIPGGAALFNRRTGLFCDHDAITRGASLLIVAHAIRRVVLLAHEGCGYYRARFPTDADAERRDRQLADLEVARAAILAEHRAVEVTTYFASPAGNRVVIRPVA